MTIQKQEPFVQSLDEGTGSDQMIGLDREIVERLATGKTGCPHGARGRYSCRECCQEDSGKPIDWRLYAMELRMAFDQAHETARKWREAALMLQKQRDELRAATVATVTK